MVPYFKGKSLPNKYGVLNKNQLWVAPHKIYINLLFGKWRLIEIFYLIYRYQTKGAKNQYVYIIL